MMSAAAFRRTPRPARRGALVLLCLAPVLAGCETLTRMDYLDRIFEPERFATPAPAAQPQPDPVPEAPAPAPEVVAMEPRPNPPAHPAAGQLGAPVRGAEQVSVSVPGADDDARLRQTVRRNPWLTRFWSELTAAQQLRVERQLPRGEAQARAEPAGAWDSMGLSDRARLVFGRGLSPDSPAPAERQEGSTWAGRP